MNAAIRNVKKISMITTLVSACTLAAAGCADELHFGEELEVSEVTADLSVLSRAYVGRVESTDWQLWASGDFDRNGVPDILWRQLSTGRLDIWYMGGTGGATPLASRTIPHAVADTKWQIEGVADFNRDGTPDIFWREVYSGRMDVWYMAGTYGNQISSIKTSVHQVPDIYWRVDAIGDLDRDSIPDLVWRHSPTGRIDTWFMDGPDGLRAKSTRIVVTSSSVVPIDVDDMNGDGWGDIIIGGWGTIAVWYMQGATRLSVEHLTFDSYSPDLFRYAVFTGDFNRDGTPDIFSRDYLPNYSPPKWGDMHVHYLAKARN